MERMENIPFRAAGVLLPVSSLPSPYGIGSFGETARRFIDFLHDAGQSYWQVLPLGPTSYGDSPYQSFSAFAGNPYFVDLDTLREQGLLDEADYADIDWGEAGTVDYAALYEHRETVLRIACGRFVPTPGFRAFCERHAHWLANYSLFMAIKASQGNGPWYAWPAALKHCDEATLSRCKKDLAADIHYHCFVQYQFFTQWEALRAYAKNRGVEIIGDMPIYVSLDSADVWADKGLFQLGPDAMPVEIAGCPPDNFAKEGQLWGNPLYAWDVMKRTGYAWWLRRMQAYFQLYDVLRIDHFRGLESYFAIPADGTAAEGRWRPGPKMGLIDAIRAGVPNVRMIAEDLGFLTDGVRKLQRESGYPGMKVLQFAFDSREPGDYSPYRYDANNVVYTGTHDNDTMCGWAYGAAESEVEYAMDYVGVDSKAQLPDAMIRLAMQNPAQLCVIPLQDWLGLGSEARLNTPSTLGGSNWRWRMDIDALTKELRERIYHMTALYGRNPKGKETVTLDA